MLAALSRPSTRARFALVLALLAAPRAAAADAPGPRPVCQTEGVACESCWRPYGGGPDEQTYASCKDAETAKGLVEACHEQQGGGDKVFFCPKGAKVPTRIEYFGCGGCTVSGTPGLAGIVMAAAGLGALVLRRRRSSVP